jgi:hypothetical protein
MPGDLKLKIFRSVTINAEVSSMIWFSPDDDAERAARYPVLYELPASGGSPRKNPRGVAKRVETAIRDRGTAPMIIVGVPLYAGTRWMAIRGPAITRWKRSSSRTSFSPSMPPIAPWRRAKAGRWTPSRWADSARRTSGSSFPKSSA